MRTSNVLADAHLAAILIGKKPLAFLIHGRAPFLSCRQKNRNNYRNSSIIKRILSLLKQSQRSKGLWDCFGIETTYHTVEIQKIDLYIYGILDE